MTWAEDAKKRIYKETKEDIAREVDKFLVEKNLVAEDKYRQELIEVVYGYRQCISMPTLHAVLYNN